MPICSSYHGQHKIILHLACIWQIRILKSLYYNNIGSEVHYETCGSEKLTGINYSMIQSYHIVANP